MAWSPSSGALLSRPEPANQGHSATLTIGFVCVVVVFTLAVIGLVASSPHRDIGVYDGESPFALYYRNVFMIRQDPALQLFSSLFLVSGLVSILLTFGVLYVLAHPALYLPSVAVLAGLIYAIARLVVARRRARLLGPAIVAIDVQEAIATKDIADDGGLIPAGKLHAGEVIGLKVRLALKPTTLRKVRFHYRFVIEDVSGIRFAPTEPRRATLDPNGPTSLTFAYQCKIASEKAGGMPAGTYFLKFLIDQKEAASRPVELKA